MPKISSDGNFSRDDVPNRSHGADERGKVSIPNCYVVSETTMALQVGIGGDGPQAGHVVWIPKSQIDDDSEVYKKGTEGLLVITEWIALQKELI